MPVVGTTALTELWSKVKALVSTKQDALVSGTNIKTVNNQSLLGSGNISISGGSGGGDGDSQYSIGYTQSTRTVKLTGSNGGEDSQFTLPLASSSVAGLESAADKAAVDRLDAAVKTGVGVGLYGNTKGSDGFYHRFMLTETPNIRHDVSPDGSVWAVKEYFVKAYQPGETFTQNMYTAGFVTSSSKNVCFFVPLDRPVSDQVTSVTCETKGTLTLRGVAGYTHGSSASAGVTPSSVTCAWRNNGIDVTCVMSATTNVTNNTPIGVSMSGFVFKFN